MLRRGTDGSKPTEEPAALRLFQDAVTSRRRDHASAERRSKPQNARRNVLGCGKVELVPVSFNEMMISAEIVLRA